MTPGGPLDLATVLLGNRVIIIGQYINSQVAQRVISQLVTLAAVDEEGDILVSMHSYVTEFIVLCSSRPSIIYYCSILSSITFFYNANFVPALLDISELPWWKSLLHLSYL